MVRIKGIDLMQGCKKDLAMNCLKIAFNWIMHFLAELQVQYLNENVK